LFILSGKYKKLIFHIDVNSAYLSWSAIKLLQYGNNLDIRKIPSIIGGKEENRHGIVLAASIPAKKLGIKTGETIYSAKEKCKNLKIYLPDYNWYIKSSDALYEILEEYSPKIQRYSIDECFMEMNNLGESYYEKANEIKNRISKELGFNCNIGISTNKLLAKMASDFKPKNSVHTLFKEEIEKKMWPLDIRDLFMVGKATEIKLKNLNINTIGELATFDLNILRDKLKSQGNLVYEYANGRDNSKVRKSNYLEIKGIGNSTTISYDITTYKEAKDILLSLTESVTSRLRSSKKFCRVIVVSIKTNNFISYSHQKKLTSYTDSTNLIYKEVKEIFKESWKGESIRHLGIRLTGLSENNFYQENLFDFKKTEKEKNLDSTIDLIRKKYGKNSIVRSSFVNSGIRPLTGGTGSEEEYPMMSSIL
jgi:DNA polymerase IV